MKPQYSIEPGEHDLDIDALIASAQEASGFLKALAHEGRLLILCLLIEEEKSVTAIEEILSLRQPAISQQLARLRADGLVETRREGKNIFYSLARPEVREVIGALHRAFCRQPRFRLRATNRHTVARAARARKGPGAASVRTLAEYSAELDEGRPERHQPRCKTRRRISLPLPAAQHAVLLQQRPPDGDQPCEIPHHGALQKGAYRRQRPVRRSYSVHREPPCRLERRHLSQCVLKPSTYFCSGLLRVR